jgi:methanogenic corrinoid protein MtbC1
VTVIAEQARDAYWSAVADADRPEAVRIALEQLDAGIGLADVLSELVCSTQLEVGRRWAANEWNVAQEHAATSIGEDVVAALAAQRPSAVSRGSVVVACAEGEWHSLPARVLAETLRVDGWRVRYLGASVPATHLLQMLHDLGPDAVALSCSVSTSLPRARRMIEASREAGVPIIVGGSGFGPGGRWGLRLGANAWAPDATAALDVLSAPEWPAYADPAPAYSPPDTDSDAILANVPALVAGAMTELGRRLPSMASYTVEQRARTEEDFGHILNFLAVALYVDDVELFTNFVSWLADLLVPRHVPLQALEISLQVVESALAGKLGERLRARSFLDAGSRALTPG